MLFRSLGIKIFYSQPRRHTTNGLAERANRTIEEALRHYLNPERNNWKEFLPAIQWAVNTALASSTRISPYMLDHCREPVFPVERLMEEEHSAALESQEEEDWEETNQKIQRATNLQEKACKMEVGSQ